MTKSVIKNSLVWFVCPVNFHVEAIQFTNLHETEYCIGIRVMPWKELAAMGIMRTLTTRTVVILQQDLDLLNFCS